MQYGSVFSVGGLGKDRVVLSFTYLRGEIFVFFPVAFSFLLFSFLLSCGMATVGSSCLYSVISECHVVCKMSFICWVSSPLLLCVEHLF